MAALPPSTPVRGGLYRTVTARKLDMADDTSQSRPILSTDGLDRESAPLERRCVLRIHDEATSKEEIVINFKHFSKDNLKQGQLMAIIALKSDTTGVRDFQTKSPTVTKTYENLSSSICVDPNLPDIVISREGLGNESHHNVDTDKKYVFAVKGMSADMRTKQPQAEVSISKQVADAFGFKNRSTVLLTTVSNPLLPLWSMLIVLGQHCFSYCLSRRIIFQRRIPCSI